ncbi:hypothetical protein CY34DRAFT_806961 [Suillus luteus UH-Slu-Lm8-n1]|uniref:Uncharacterized protein n=1 Tax=Suillus luteus UH-Slu-Lm8-n1 TaxID=930992 RepID=A0A0C9ZS93_9AGAM|nr:hypothetical protein CY34DRAFT_806961 [Suillus luteus UH-Slu-Lm8-n1]
MFARSSSAFLYVLLALTAFVATTCASHTTVTNVNDYGVNPAHIIVLNLIALNS